MKKNAILIFLLVGLGLSACFNYEAQFEGAYTDEDLGAGGQLKKELVIAAGGTVYLTDPTLRSFDPIESTRNADIRLASINFSHTQVLYKTPTGNIQIYDIAAATEVDEVPDSEAAIWFDFHHNNETVYFLDTEGLLHTYGPTVLARQPLDLNSLLAPTRSVEGAAILPGGEVVFSTFAFGSFNRRYLRRTNVALNEVEVNIETQSAARYFRLDSAATAVWVGNEFDNRLASHVLPQLGRIEESSNYVLGAPQDVLTGFFVTQNNEIQRLDLVTIPSPGGIITAIDF